MREIDTEAPVVWPSWCYAGETPTDESSALVKNLSSTTATFHPSNLPQQLNSATLSASLAAVSASAVNPIQQTNKYKGKRKSSLINNHIDKMLSDRMNLADSKKFCDINSSVSNNSGSGSAVSAANVSLLYDKFKQAQAEANNMDYLKHNSSGNNGDVLNAVNNNNTITNNNTSIKSERLSPPHQPTHQQSQSIQHNGGNGDAQSSHSRSRSATPSSYPGTPPQHHPSEAIGASNYTANTANTGLSILPTGNQMKANEYAPRNYSDFIRNLAAKYNNNNPNESNNSRNLFFDPRFNISPLKPVSAAKDSPSPPENLKRLPTSSAATAPTPNPSNLMQSIFPGISFPSSVFPPLIDMSSTQALVNLARVAKEAEIQQILKGPTKRPSKSHLTSNNRQHQQQSPSSNPNASPQNRLSLSNVPAALQYMSLQQKASSLISQSLAATAVSQTAAATTSTSMSSGSNSNETHIRPASPLDLSASTPITKRLKMESPSPVRSLGSPPATQLQPSQMATRNRAQTPSVAGSTTSSNTVIATASAAGVPTNATSQRRCHAQSDEINSWTVAQVCDFVSSIDICAEYVENFRDQCIDGSGLPLLTEDHLMNSLNMKLGPALKLRSVLLKRLGGPCPCVSCVGTAAPSAINNPVNTTSSMCAASPTGSTTRPASTDSGT